MAENTKIQWATHTFNPWVGCQKISDACKFCYAEAWAKRTGQAGLWQGERRRTSEANWKSPLKWNKEAKESHSLYFEGLSKLDAAHPQSITPYERPRVFCASLADVFEDHRAIDPQWRVDLFSLVNETPSLDWLLLTKRPENCNAMIEDIFREMDWFDPPDYSNIWIGTTTENQECAAKRIPELLKVPAKVRFLSVEPMLGQIDLSQWLGDWPEDEDGAPYTGNGLQWVIAGGESGGKARYSSLAWFRDLRDQCKRAGVAFFMKQLGEPLARELGLKDKKGGDMEEWPEDLRIRELPNDLR